ncbi:hypothetical protein [Kineococcus sp. SYSU DK002]|uniref:hypothetical protein n=1 Tax=Kineococcus sp. SYSU DK002 TaxID=3383123 RepID=UPI003D7D06E9
MSTGDDGSRGGRRRGHLRGVRGDATSTTGTTTDETTSDQAGGDVDVDDNSFSVPDLLATDALLDRLGRHEATTGDLSDAVARLLDSYALHADPETAGVRPVELPDLDGAGLAPEHVPAPRVLLARRRTLQRLGRGTVAAAAVLTLLGGTAAAAATGVGPLGDRDGRVAASFASQLPGWFPDTVFQAFAGTPAERVQRELSQVQALAQAGDDESASARLKNLRRQLDGADVDAAVVQRVDEALAVLAAEGDLTGVALDAPTGSPTASPTGSPTGTTLADVAVVATPTPAWAPTRQAERPTATPSPSATGGADGTGPTGPTGAAGSATPPRATGTSPAVPVVPVVPNAPAGGSGDAPAGPSAPTGPPQAPGSSAPADTPTAPATDVPTQEPTGTPTQEPTEVPTQDPDVTPTDPVPSAEPTTDQTPGATPPDPGAATGPAPGTDEPAVATPTLPAVVEPSPSAGLVPVPGTADPAPSGTGVPDASDEAPAGS